MELELKLEETKDTCRFQWTITLGLQLELELELVLEETKDWSLRSGGDAIVLPSIAILELVKMEPKMILLELLEVVNGFRFAACPSCEMSERLFKRRFGFYYHLPLRPARWHLPSTLFPRNFHHSELLL